jgi:hypothetical protein
LNITAKQGLAHMAVWNEVVHIYSGRVTSASHNFAAADFSGVLQLAGFAYSGELGENKVQSSIVSVYGDPNYISRIASFEVNNYTKGTGAFYYEGAWAVNVPGSLAGQDVYFSIDENIYDPGGNKPYTWNLNGFTVPADGKTDIKLYGSYTWSKWVSDDLDSNSFNISIGQDGTVTATTSNIDNYVDYWQQDTTFNYPMELNRLYVYEFEAWTTVGDRDLLVQFIDTYPWNTINDEELIAINTTRTTFTIVSNTRTDSKTRAIFKFKSGSNTAGSFNIKMKSIKTSWEYVMPDPEGGEDRWTATPASDGILIKIYVKDLPDAIQPLVVRNETNGNLFYVDIGSGRDYENEYYEFIYPFVEGGSEYVFKVNSWNHEFTNVTHTVTAIGGLGELNFTNKAQLALIKNGNNIQFNQTPVLPAYISDISGGQYVYDIATGTSWSDPSALWRGNMESNTAQPVDLLEAENLAGWINAQGFFSSVVGKTCFTEVFYMFNFDDSDYYPNGDTAGAFRTASISSAPFTYPVYRPDSLTATATSEGIKLVVQRTDIPEGTIALQFHQKYNNGAYLYIGDGEWKEEWGRHYNKDTIEIIYPFVKAGSAYDFVVRFEGTSTRAEAAVTATAGLGEMVISNFNNLGLLYSGSTRTMTLSGTPIAPSLANSSKITRKYWQWQFYNGQNWDDSQWLGAIDSNNPILSMTFDESFDFELTIKMANNLYSFVNSLYRVVYDGYDFDVQVSPSSPPFHFPVVGNSSTDSGLNGTWESSLDWNENYTIATIQRITFFNGMAVMSYIIMNFDPITGDWLYNTQVPVMTGTYTTDDGQITITPTRVDIPDIGITPNVPLTLFYTFNYEDRGWYDYEEEIYNEQWVLLLYMRYDEDNWMDFERR